MKVNIKSAQCKKHGIRNILAIILTTIIIKNVFFVFNLNLKTILFIFIDRKIFMDIFNNIIIIIGMFVLSFYIESKFRKANILKYFLILFNIAMHKIIFLSLLYHIDNFYIRAWNIVFFCQYFLKIISFHIESKNYYKSYFSNKEKKEFNEQKSWTNLENMIQLLLTPTLIFYKKQKTNFKINKIKILTRIFFMMICIWAFKINKDNFILESLQNIDKNTSFREFFINYCNLIIYIFLNWCLLFIFYFVAYFGILKELTGFNDFPIYKDWYNATSLGEFWSKWNQPFYLYMKKYIYKEKIKEKYGKIWAKMIVFVLSALIHEYAVSLACRQFSGLLLFIMSVQVPFHCLGEFFFKKHHNLGNLYFWFCMCVLGQPLIIYFLYTLNK